MQSSPNAYTLVVNCGTASIKFALFNDEEEIQKIIAGRVDNVGRDCAELQVWGLEDEESFSKIVDAPDHKNAALILLDVIKAVTGSGEISAIGHRVSEGGLKFYGPRYITPEVLFELKRGIHSPTAVAKELSIIEVLQDKLPGIPQVAFFDTDFLNDMTHHSDYPEGFHGVSCEFIMHELMTLIGHEGIRERIILAHLGSSASVAALYDEIPIDAVTIPSQGPIKKLLLNEKQDLNSQEAITNFCYEIKKRIGSFSAALEGLDYLVFTGGIGENEASIRAQICEGLEFLGIEIQSGKNEGNINLISTRESEVAVYVIPTDEEWMMADFLTTFIAYEKPLSELAQEDTASRRD